MAGLQVGQALWCSSYLGLGSAVPAPMFQPPYVTKALICYFPYIESWAHSRKVSFCLLEKLLSSCLRKHDLYNNNNNTKFIVT